MAQKNRVLARLFRCRAALRCKANQHGYFHSSFVLTAGAPNVTHLICRRP